MAFPYLIGRLHGTELAVLFQGVAAGRCVARCAYRQTEHRLHHPLGVYLPTRESYLARTHRLAAHLRRGIPYAVNRNKTELIFAHFKKKAVPLQSI